jgi:competence protein ComEC
MVRLAPVDRSRADARAGPWDGGEDVKNGLILAAALAAATTIAADEMRKPTLDLYWVDVEGGAATLIVTPAGETVLIDTGFPGGRDAKRIHKVATEMAGRKRIDHVIVTHFHRDHFGGVAELAELMPVGTLYERELTRAPESERSQPELEPYRKAKVERRVVITAGSKIPLRPVDGAAPVFLDVLGANGEFVPGGKPSATCGEGARKDADPSDNRNSVVSLLRFGGFRFFDGGDLTWNAEADLVCSGDRLGGVVDVFQINHHGLDNSNNPVLVESLAPAVVVINNGPRKGGEAGTFANLRRAASRPTVYQVHRSLNAPDGNTAADRIANAEESCAGHFIKLSVDPQGRSYSVAVPSTGHQQTYAVRRP